MAAGKEGNGCAVARVEVVVGGGGGGGELCVVRLCVVVLERCLGWEGNALIMLHFRLGYTIFPCHVRFCREYGGADSAHEGLVRCWSAGFCCDGCVVVWRGLVISGFGGCGV